MFCVEGTVWHCGRTMLFDSLFFCKATCFDAKWLLTPALKGWLLIDIKSKQQVAQSQRLLLIDIKSMQQVSQIILFWQNSRCWTWVFHLQTVHSVLNKSFLVFLWSNLQSFSIIEHLCHTFEHRWPIKCETLSSVLHFLVLAPKNQWIQLHNTAMYWGSVAGLGH